MILEFYDLGFLPTLPRAIWLLNLGLYMRDEDLERQDIMYVGDINIAF